MLQGAFFGKIFKGDKDILLIYFVVRKTTSV